MSRSGSADPRDLAAQIRAEIQDAYVGLGVEFAGYAADLPSIDDIRSLVEAGGQARKILQVGGGTGASTLVLALAFPDARIVRVDPDLPLADSGGHTAGGVARKAAHALGVEGRIEFVTGGFSETVTKRSVIDADLRSERVQARMAGPEACSREQPFDVAYVDGLTASETRASDIRLAASALAPDGVIVSANSVGESGATVRAGVYEFLRYFPAYTFAHDRLDDTSRTLGFLKRREAGWAGDRRPADARSAIDAPMEVRDRLADLVALTVGKRPILEVAMGSPVLGATYRARGLASRTLRLTGADWDTHFFDPVIDQISNALDHTPGSVLFSADLMDFAPDEFVGRLFARLEDRRSHALFFATPPGEALAAGPRSRPAARIVDLAASQNVRAFAPAALEFERTRHEGAGRTGWLGGTSRYASFMMFSGGEPGRDMRGRSIPEVSPQVVQVREQVELQRIWSEAALQRSLETATVRRSTAERERDDALTRWRESQQVVDRERAEAERSLASLRADLDQLRSEFSQLSQEKVDGESALQQALEVAASRQTNAERERDDALNRWRETAEIIDRERGEAQRSLSSVQDEVQELRADYARLADEKAAAERAAQEARTALELEVERLRGEVTSLTTARDAAITDLGAATARAAEASQSGDQRVSELEGEVERWRAERDALALEKDEAEQARLAAETERDEAEQARKAAEGERERVEQGLRAQISQLESRPLEVRRDDEGELEELRRRWAGAQAEIEALELRHETALKARESEVGELRAELSAESLQVVDAQCREVDAQASLEGIANHLAVTHDAINRFRTDPDTYDADDVPYPVRADVFDGKDEDLVARATELHGRSADLSREVAKELERLGRARRDYEEWKRRQIEISETSHGEAMRLARSEFQNQFWTQERLNARIASGVAFNNRLLADILSLTPGFIEDPAELSAEVAELELTANSAVSLDALEQVAAQEKRLMHLLHTLEAEEAMDAEDVEFELELEERVETVEEYFEDDGGDADDAEAPLFPDDRVVRPAGFASGGEGLTRSVDNVAREMDPDDVPEESRVLEFTRPERSESAGSWSFGGAPVWQVEQREVDAGRRRMFWSGLWDRIRTYPETARLVRLQQALRDELVACPVSPRVFDVDLYHAQGSSEPYAEPLHHYLVEGEKQGWSPLAGFDPAYYATQVGDLGGWKGSLLRHFLSRGVHDRRSPSKALEGLSDRATAAGMEPLEYFYHWENAARGTWWEDRDTDD